MYSHHNLKVVNLQIIVNTTIMNHAVFETNNHFLNIWLLAARLLGWQEGQLGIA
jgi:hypothetical protein